MENKGANFVPNIYLKIIIFVIIVGMILAYENILMTGTVIACDESWHASCMFFWD
jgi:hypothetical protein